jgi:hypothetical protein
LEKSSLENEIKEGGEKIINSCVEKSSLIDAKVVNVDSKKIQRKR